MKVVRSLKAQARASRRWAWDAVHEQQCYALDQTSINIATYLFPRSPRVICKVGLGFLELVAAGL